MRAALALGSNLPSRFGDRAANLHEALHRLHDLGTVVAASRFYETAPVGFISQPRFLNAAALLDTDLGPLPLLRGLLSLEEAMGRVRSADAPPKGPRVIDLDLLLYEDEAARSLILRDPELILPHPEMHIRSFVLQPLAEIASAMWHPAKGCTVRDLAAQFNASELEPLARHRP